ATGDEEQVPRVTPHDERRAERAEEVQRVPNVALGDPLSAGPERLHDQLDLARAPVYAAERVRASQQRIPSDAGAHVHELPSVRLRGDLRCAYREQRPQFADLRVGHDAAFLEHHGSKSRRSGTPTENV